MKTRGRIILPILALILSLRGAVPQEPKDKDAIEIPIVLKTGDCLRYEIARTTTGEKGPGTLKSVVTIQVARADESGWLISWEHGDWQAEGPGQELNPDDLKAVNLMMKVRLLLSLDRHATNMRLANWEELRDQLQKGLDALTAGMPKDGMSKEMAYSPKTLLRSMYQNRELMTSYYTQEPQAFFAFPGKSLPLSKPLEAEVQLPNPFGGEPFPGRSRVVVTSVEKKGHRAVVASSMKLDPERMPKILEQITKDMGLNLGVPSPEGFSIKNVAVDFMAEYDFDLVSGWPNSLTLRKVSKIEGMSQEETTTMKRLPEAKPPVPKKT